MNKEEAKMNIVENNPPKRQITNIKEKNLPPLKPEIKDAVELDTIAEEDN